MENTTSVQEIIQSLRKRLWLIIMITISITAVTAVISYFFITPIYEARTEIIVNQSKDEQQVYSYNEIQTNLQLVTTYTGIIKSPVILEKVKENLKLDSPISTLKEQVRIENEKNSQIISIVVENPVPALAVEISNEVAKVFQTELVKIMNIDNVNVLAEAESTQVQSPVRPNPTINIAIALVMGVFIGGSTAFLIEYFDNTVKTESDIEQLLNQSVLGVVSTFEQKNEKVQNAQRRKIQTTRSESIGS